MSALDRIVAEVLGVEETQIDEETGPATTADWSSLRHVQIIAAVGREFGIRLTPRQARSCRSVGELRTLLVEKGLPA